MQAKQLLTLTAGINFGTAGCSYFNNLHPTWAVLCLLFVGCLVLLTSYKV